MPNRPVQAAQHHRDVLARREHKHLVARLNARFAIAGDETVGLVGKAPVQGDDAHGQVRHARTDSANRLADHWRAGACTCRDQAGAAASKLAHLHGLGVLNQLADVARKRLFRANDPADTKALVAGQHLAVETARAHAGDARRNVEQELRHLAAHQIGFVLRRAGNQEVGVARPCLGQHAGLDPVADHAAQVKTRFELAQAPRVYIDDGNVIALGDQTLRNAAADAPRAEDDDFHARRLFSRAPRPGPAPPI